MTTTAATREEHVPSARTGALVPPARAVHFQLFDGLRAIAACFVLLDHTSNATQAEYNAWYGRFTSRLNLGVAIFFVISGFLLYRPFFRARWEGRPRPRVKQYLLRRALRIIPAYWLALTVAGLTLNLAVFTGDWWKLYGFGQIYSPHTAREGLTIAWTLCIEVTFYLVLPVLAAVLARASRGRARRMIWQVDLVVLVALVLASNLFRAWAEAHHPYLASTLPAAFDWFVPGMLLAAASVVLAEPAHASLPRAVDLVARRPAACWWAALAMFLVLAVTLDIRHILFESSTVSFFESTYDHWAQMAIAVLIVLPAVFGTELGGIPRRVLALRAVSWLGIVSYGIYLWHQVVIDWLKDLGILRLGLHPLPTLTAATFVLAVLCAAVSWYGLERPLQRFRSVGLRRSV
jgi:peptidoglycan/LPS O-acetylase OafA/YrhL